MTRVLLTGASGFIGANVLGYMLKETDWEFVCICSWGHKGNPLRLQKYANDPRVTIVSHDLTAPLPDLGDFDYILNLASESHVDRSIAEPESFTLNNVALVLNMLKYARQHKPKIFLQFSTDEVFGDIGHEDDRLLNPSSPYGGSKAAQEMIASSQWRTFGVPLIITNSNNIIGEGQDPEKFLPKMVEIIRAGATAEIHTSGGKPTTRYWNPVENVSAALLFILTHDKAKPASFAEGAEWPSRFGIPGGEPLTTVELAEMVAETMGMEFKYELVDGNTVRPGIDRNYPRSHSRLLDIGFKPPLTLKEGLEWLRQM